MNNLTNQQLESLILRYPAMKFIVEFKGTIGEFYQPQNLPILNKIKNRSDIIIDAICKVSNQIFTEEDSKIIRSSLNTNYFASSAEHHASITHPESLNVVLNQFLIQKEFKLPLVALSCSTTTLDNELFPRGLYYNNYKIPILSSSLKSHFVYNTIPLQFNIFENKLKMLVKDRSLTELESNIIMEYFLNLLSDIKTEDQFSKQISLINKKLWTLFVDDDLNYKDLNYFMIPAEKITNEILIHEISFGAQSWVYKCIFDKEIRQSLLSLLDGNRICWDSNKEKGTFLFWGYLKNKKPVQLVLVKNQLLSRCGQIQIDLDKNSVLDALKKGIISPSSSLFFLYFVFYGGLNCMGGILQVNYLSEMKNKLLQWNQNILSREDLEIISNVHTNLYANFQSNEWTRGGLAKIKQKLNLKSLNEYKSVNHFNQIQECLCFLNDQN